MDPLSIVVSAIALGEVGQKAVKIIVLLRKHINPSDEIDALQSDIENLHFILGITSSALPTMQPEAAHRMARIIRECHQVLIELERIMQGCENTLNKTAGMKFRTTIIRLYWMRKLPKVRSLKGRLGELLFALLLCLTAIGSGRRNDDIAPSSLRNRVIQVHPYHQIIGSGLLRDREPLPTMPSVHVSTNHTNLTRIATLPDPGCRSRPLISIPDGQNASTGLPSTGIPVVASKNEGWHTESESSCVENRITHNPLTPVPEISEVRLGRFLAQQCRKSCACSCHRRLAGCISIFGGRLGYFQFRQTGNLLNFRQCSLENCRAGGCTPSSLSIFYSGTILRSVAVALSIINSGRIRFALSFPRMLPPDHDLFIAIRIGDCDRIRELLATGKASPADIAAPYGLTALDLALYYGQTAASALLISEGAPQFLPAKSYWSVCDIQDFFASFNLIHSTINSKSVMTDMMKMLGTAWLLESLQANRTLEPFGFSDLHGIVIGFSSKQLDSISSHKIREQVNEVDSFGRTPLYWAVSLGESEIARRLLLCGADPNIADLNGTTALDRAASFGSVECIALLIDAGANLESKDRMGSSCLRYACSQGHRAAVEYLLDHGSNVQSATYLDEAPIECASHGFQPKLVELLLKHGASVHQHDIWGFTPVLDAVFGDSHEALDILLREDWDRSACLFDGKSILHVAALNSDLRTIEILLNTDLTGVDPYHRDNAGFTPLEYIRRRKDAQDLIEPFCGLLLKLGPTAVGAEDESRQNEDTRADSDYEDDEFFDAEY